VRQPRHLTAGQPSPPWWQFRPSRPSYAMEAVAVLLLAVLAGAVTALVLIG
jgi:hypothetical protein